MISRSIAVAMAGAAALLATLAGRELLRAAGDFSALGNGTRRWRLIARQLFSEGRIDESFGGRRVFVAALAVGAVAGFSAIGSSFGSGVP